MTEKPVAIVTGVGPATGSAIVKRFSAGGFRVVALARSVERLNALAETLPDVHAIPCAVSGESAVRAAVPAGRQRVGSPDVLVHNAIGGAWGNFAQSTLHVRRRRVH